MTVATIQKWGNSQGIRIPKHILDEADIGASDKVEMVVSNGKILIRKLSEKKTIKTLFAGYEGQNDEREIDWGDSVGREIW